MPLNFEKENYSGRLSERTKSNCGFLGIRQIGDSALSKVYFADWCPRRDSNPEPTDYESAALTVELQGHNNLRVVDFGL